MQTGFRLPDRSPIITDAELAWLTFLRELHHGPVRPPALAAIQALRRALEWSAGRLLGPARDRPLHLAEGLLRFLKLTRKESGDLG